MNQNNQYKTVLTRDGSTSLFSNEFNELMHDKNGAYEEALQKHIIPSKVLTLTKNKTITVLDVGFGSGYNVLALISELKKINFQNQVQIYSLEKDSSALSILKTFKFNDERDVIYSDILKALEVGHSNHNNNFNIKLMYGDARQNILKLLKEQVIFDIVFQDPFSPAKNPELWTVDYFNVIYKLMNDNAILTTYSYALQIRMAMLIASFKIGKSIIAGKKEGTIATKSASILQLSDEEILSIKSNIKSTPYYDKEFNNTRENILNKRTTEIKQRREKQNSL